MGKNILITIGVLMLCLVAFVGALLMSSVGTLNTDAKQKNRIEAQVETRDLFFDKLFKVISQKTQITKADAAHQKELVEALVQGRSGGFVKLIHESNPESLFTREQFTTLSNSVEAQREGFFREQKELLDLVRENHTLHDKVFSGFILSIAGREKVEKPQIISSAAAKQVIESGEDNDINLGL